MGIIVARSAHSLQFEAGVGRGRFMSAESIYSEPGCKYMLEGSGVRVWYLRHSLPRLTVSQAVNAVS